MLTPLPIMLVVGLVYGRFVRRLQGRVQSALAGTSTSAEESISLVRHVRAFGREDTEIERYIGSTWKVFLLGRRYALFAGVYASGVELLAYCSVLLVIGFGAYLLTEEPPELSAGAFSAFLLYTIEVAHALGAFAGNGGEFMRSVGASDRIFEIMDVKPDPRQRLGTQQLLSLRGDVAFLNVSFTYATRPDLPALRDVSFAMPVGTVTAIVGGSGAGKSTLVALLLRLYDLDADCGSITLDGVNVGDLDVDWLRQQVGYVSQDPVLFATSVRENIAYGVADAQQEAIEAAAKAAFAHDFIAALPDGYDTIVGERGTRLSGGQRQRIAIARALFKRPRILVFDEATSALDAESEFMVQKAMESALRGRTVLIIAHRLSTVVLADNIVVLELGRVVQSGKHDELLLQRNGPYAKLVRRQLRPNKASEKETIDAVPKMRVKKRIRRVKAAE